MKRNLVTTVMVTLLFITGPAFAMMGGMGSGHGHMGMGSEQRPDSSGAVNAPQHYHGDYSHRHEGGNIPHSHGAPTSSPIRSKTVESPAQPDGSRPAGPTPEPASTENASDVNATNKGAQESRPVAPRPTTEIPPPPPRAKTLTLNDDMVMHPIAAQSLDNRAEPAAGGGKSVPRVFYLDETLVTNYQYVDFLNQVSDKIKIRQGVAYGNDQPWIMLGQVIPGYEPIIFVNGKFEVNGAHHAVCPVLRVTGYGAMAYATFYGKRLPTIREWSVAYLSGKQLTVAEIGARAEGGAPSPAENPAPSPAGEGVGGSKPHPVALDAQDANGIRGLGGDFAEWVRADDEPSPTKEARPRAAVIGQPLEPAPGSEGELMTLSRYPWEAFADVGFRTVLPAEKAASHVRR